MKWYIAKLVFNININNGSNTSQFDEQLRLIEASEPGTAFIKARSLGKSEEDSFLNEKGENVTWEFIDVTDVQPLNELRHGAEIYTSTHKDDQPEEYINFIRLKALMIQSDALVYA
ncbi:MAG TPA: DUF4288 domain-containing protein [Bacteroidia bacterium]|nr:DUF4288 domain-containing protein [Bacteroidia bacterium]